MKIRNKETGQVFEVMKGSIYPSFFEEVKEDLPKVANNVKAQTRADMDRIKVGETKVEFEIEEPKPEKKTTGKTTKTKKGAKKNGTTKTK